MWGFKKRQPRASYVEIKWEEGASVYLNDELLRYKKDYEIWFTLQIDLEGIPGSLIVDWKDAMVLFDFPLYHKDIVRIEGPTISKEY